MENDSDCGAPESASQTLLGAIDDDTALHVVIYANMC